MFIYSNMLLLKIAYIGLYVNWSINVNQNLKNILEDFYINWSISIWWPKKNK